jgi:hypothetical protein
MRQLVAQLRQTHGLLAREFGQARLDRGERLGIGEDLSGFLERFVFIDGTSAAAGLPLRVTST